MTGRAPRLLVHAAPFVHARLTTPRLMAEVNLLLLPPLAVATYRFGLAALLVVAAAVVGAVATERWLSRDRASLRDGSGLLTGVLLGLTLPPGLPLWMALLGGIVAIGLGKLAFGGLGHNLFNPALVGRAFLQAAFPIAITTWTPPGRGFFELPASTLAWPLMRGAVDGTSAATPLLRMKFEHAATPMRDLLLGDTAGSLGETSALVVVLCGLWLAWRRAFDWRIPVAVVVAAALTATVCHLWAPDRMPGPWFVLASGSLLFGAVYMATDPVTSPTTPAGAWVFGAGIGFLVVLIRLFGGLAEGVMYAILLMNAATPLIERAAQPRPFGRERRA